MYQTKKSKMIIIVLILFTILFYFREKIVFFFKKLINKAQGNSPLVGSFGNHVTKKRYYEHILESEGGQSDTDTNSAFAPGTQVNVNKGVNWDSYVNFKNSNSEIPMVQEFLEMPYDVWEAIANNSYWDRWNLDSLNEPALQYLIHSYAWGSGNMGSEIQLANFLRENYDHDLIKNFANNINDIKKPEVISFINHLEPTGVFDSLVTERKRLFNSFSTSHLYANGWIARLNRLVDLIK